MRLLLPLVVLFLLVGMGSVSVAVDGSLQQLTPQNVSDFIARECPRTLKASEAPCSTLCEFMAPYTGLPTSFRSFILRDRSTFVAQAVDVGTARHIKGLSDKVPTAKHTVMVPSIPFTKLSGKGVVITADGSNARHVANLRRFMYVLRILVQSQIPVEVWYGCEVERFKHNTMRRLRAFGVRVLGARVHELTQFRSLQEHTTLRDPCTSLSNYAIKVAATLASGFREVVVFDCDSIPLMDPAHLLLHDPWYTRMRIRVFRDVEPVGTTTPEPVFEYLGVLQDHYSAMLGGQEVDASCVVVDKGAENVWAALHVALFLNTRVELVSGLASRTLYRRVREDCGGLFHGDKDTWWLSYMVVDHQVRKGRAHYIHPLPTPRALVAHHEDTSNLRAGRTCHVLYGQTHAFLLDSCVGDGGSGGSSSDKRKKKNQQQQLAATAGPSPPKYFPFDHIRDTATWEAMAALCGQLVHINAYENPDAPHRSMAQHMTYFANVRNVWKTYPVDGSIMTDHFTKQRACSAASKLEVLPEVTSAVLTRLVSNPGTKDVV